MVTLYVYIYTYLPSWSNMGPLFNCSYHSNWKEKGQDVIFEVWFLIVGTEITTWNGELENVMDQAHSTFILTTV